MLNFGRFSSLRGAKRRSNLDFRVFEIATAFEKGLAMTQKLSLYALNGYDLFTHRRRPLCTSLTAALNTDNHYIPVSFVLDISTLLDLSI